MRDEAEIRGHRRTYIGAMPGVIVRALRDAGTRNPLFMIDEIDKMGADFRGDPASAMLEVLDPEQNATFRDHYLDLPFDLSDVMFVTTANTLETIPGPLRDRMEMIQLAGYTEEEKLEIARRYLVPRQIERNGLTPSQIAFGDAALKAIDRRVHARGGRARARARDRLDLPQGRAPGGGGQSETQGHDQRRAGARAARQAQSLQRDAPAHVRAGRRDRARVDAGRRRRAVRRGDRDAGLRQADDHRPARRRDDASRRRRRSPTCARTRRDGIADDWFARHDIHVHVPAGAIPKDGPSAGVTMATALCSLLSGRPVRSDVAMTGEITLTGQVLPIGGLKEKALAAQRSGIRARDRAGAQRAGRRRDPGAPAQRPRAALRLAHRRGARDRLARVARVAARAASRRGVRRPAQAPGAPRHLPLHARRKPPSLTPE